MKLLLTDSGIRNASIHDALVDLLGKPTAECDALCVPTAQWGHPWCGPASVRGFIAGVLTVLHRLRPEAGDTVRHQVTLLGQHAAVRDGHLFMAGHVGRRRDGLRARAAQLASGWPPARGQGSCRVHLARRSPGSARRPPPKEQARR